MLVLGIESSSPIASVALVSAQKLWGEMTLNIGLTHSEQLLPLIDDLLQQTKVNLVDLEGIAVSGGPGSFTGLRIGMATAKGLAQGLKLPLVSIPTLLALAFPQTGYFGLVSAVMNARRNEVYTALFRFSGNDYEQLEPYQAIHPQLWAEKLVAYQETVLLTGDGVSGYKDIWRAALGDKVVSPPPFLQIARGASVAWLGQQRLCKGDADDLFTLKPMYIRSSEAERKLARR
ncbi:MAG TPA: tRNA (adenosine(37)-N6)-threonylcarbamoyltransferase complex dimerization subunit type 1 TsaB [Clostridia bacterium]|jgi:tRNA threonylcarbamoyladenosine biosynthesis protein TsaB|nr:tRNA (adenosine(37)-N6)-threonylcarbamoyltransferase complex dimerization subunit type 1 TsaB [Clostridia bacterium]HHY06282.1 tRNA (adenosine(37)-N6)-threonylcarbamoyltransferase complex dimerization subunit type 1 TsaB [Clostridia bacterium]